MVWCRFRLVNRTVSQCSLILSKGLLPICCWLTPLNSGKGAFAFQRSRILFHCAAMTIVRKTDVSISYRHPSPYKKRSQPITPASLPDHISQRPRTRLWIVTSISIAMRSARSCKLRSRSVWPIRLFRLIYHLTFLISVHGIGVTCGWWRWLDLGAAYVTFRDSR